MWWPSLAVPPQNQYEFVISWLKDGRHDPTSPQSTTAPTTCVRFPGWNSFAKRFVADGCRPPNCVCVGPRLIDNILGYILSPHFLAVLNCPPLVFNIY
jgi:hypothetical protein